MPKSKHYYIRKSHRYLGVLLGLQFLCWTIGGLYFSWSNIDEIHGDNQRRQPPLLSGAIQLVSPTSALDSIKKTHRVDSLVSIQLIDILGKPFYQIRCMESMGSSHHADDKSMLMNHLADASRGLVRPPLTKAEAILVAQRYFNGSPEVKQVDYLLSTNGHHEYRENPLPAYAVTFYDETNTTVYVASELGTVQKFRNNGWRVFDFLWMLHTMDYKGRDYLANVLLRTFSIVGLITIISGFALFFVSSKWFRQ